MEVAYFAGGCILGIAYALLAVTVAVYAGKKGEKPHRKEYGTENIWLCPNCGTYVGSDDIKYNFCSKCGRAIDWSEEHERFNQQRSID